MGSQLARWKAAPRSLCHFCWHEHPHYPQFARRMRPDRHVSWTKLRDLPPKELQRISKCVFCSVLTEVVRHRGVNGEEFEIGSLELPILSSRRAIKRPGGYDWKECSIVSLLPTGRHAHYSSPSGCTDLGFLALTEAHDEAHPQSVKMPVNEQYQGIPTEAKRALDFEYIQELISICTREHGKTCASKESPRVPNLRVIDCTTGTVVDAPNDCCYLALSYVWGDQSPPTANGEGTVFKPLVRDSITITQKLGFRYLWVDRHVSFSCFCGAFIAELTGEKCINQNDVHKHTMISRMGDIYSQAHITIVIATGGGANDRIPHLDGVNQALDIPVQGKIATRVFTHAACSLGESRWASRAWTYQEAYLSRRRLIFTDDDVFFLCNHVLAAESSKVCIENTTLLQSQQSDIWRFIPAPLTKEGFDLQRAQTETLKRQISDYTKKHLTYDSDSLDAFVGVLADTTRPTTDMLPLKEVWGVPYDGGKNSLSLYIDWRHEKGARRRPGFPSWSWCGWAGEASFDLKKRAPMYDERCTFDLRLDANQRVPLAEFSLNPTRPGEGPQDLLIRTRIVACKLAPGAERVEAPARPRLEFQVDDNAFARTPVWLDDARLDPGTAYAGVFLDHECGLFTTTSMLIVKEVDGDHYERVGLVEFRNHEWTLDRWYVSNGQRPLHDRFSRPKWLCVEFCDVHPYLDRDGKPYDHFKPDKLHLQPWYRDGEVKEICLR